MKARVTEKEIIVIFILMFFVTVFTGCNQSEVVKDKYPYPVVIDKGSIATGIYASTTLPEGIPNCRIVCLSQIQTNLYQFFFINMGRIENLYFVFFSIIFKHAFVLAAKESI